jgi:signal transduction histidine kinase
MPDSIGGPEGKLDSLTAWPEVLDKLIQGVTHQISNRVAILSGVSDILAGDESVPPILRALADEVPRLEASIRLLRLLAVPDGEHEEAVEATRLVDDALALARVHPDCKEVAFSAADGRDVPPIVARPTGLTHELLVALVEAAQPVGSGGMADPPASVRVGYRVDGDDLVITVGARAVRARTLVAARRQ